MEPIEQTSTGAVTPERKSSFGDIAVWMRGLYMLLLALAFGIAQTLLCVTAIAQFLWLLFSGEPNRQLVKFGSSLAKWVADTAKFLTFVSDEKPFPWAAWPAAD
ncbi:DUF4389 domain-containing protein [Hyphomicrobium sp. NDB2Meth4]|uniref:DUF4389 domain-containing protein n=1 Tax=Hyphomicrobium sp. NDB2Meth4 TaxID=1892846 RepID=UPI0009FB0D03|nr:DUF4389 domain-containing protein [Hyphomicrobium sp. NDB2Meth4]